MAKVDFEKIIRLKIGTPGKGKDLARVKIGGEFIGGSGAGLGKIEF